MRGSRIAESLRFAVAGVLANKMRSALTMLGIIIGIASVITLVAVGTGASKAVQASIDRLGSNAIVVQTSPRGVGGQGNEAQKHAREDAGLPPAPVNAAARREPALTYADVEALRDKTLVPGAVRVAPVINIEEVVTQYGGTSNHIDLLIGSTPNYLAISNSEIAVGRAFTDADYAARRGVCVVGIGVLSNLTRGTPQSMVGQTVRMNGQPFRVVGMLVPKGLAGSENLDSRAICAGTAVTDALYGYGPPGSGPINAIAVEAASGAQVPAVAEDVTTALNERRGVSAVDSDFIVLRATSLLTASNSSARTLQILLAAVAGISLLIGGIGVMNIQLVSVTERTREIGIRKAMGAERRDIVGQFLGEAVILSMVGGLLGVAVGFLASEFTIAGVVPSIAAYSVYLALGVSLLTGLVFGLYPANRAAALRPIDALRYE
ncbi:MAG: ABC transporter permease [Sporichthyaceae bacterium]